MYWKHEAIYGGGEAVSPSEYLGSGDVQEFRYGRGLKQVFNNENLANLKNFGEGWGFMESGKSAVFVDNHDTERGGDTLNYKDGANYTLASVFMLAYPYGSPDVHSGYEWSDKDAGPPSGGQVSACYSGGWKCQHAWREISSMVGFRNAARGQAVSNWWDNGGDQIAFGRGSKAYVAINHEGSALSRTFQTSLPAGTYCDVQTGNGVTVNASGQFTATLAAQTALALHVGARTCSGGGTTPDPGTGQSGASFGVNATTQPGQNIYVTGDQAALGSWAPGSALKLDPATYPVWKLDVALPMRHLVRVQVPPQGRERQRHLGERCEPHRHRAVLRQGHADRRRLARLNHPRRAGDARVSVPGPHRSTPPDPRKPRSTRPCPEPPSGGGCRRTVRGAAARRTGGHRVRRAQTPAPPTDAALAKELTRHDLTREQFYFVLPDRFADGDTSNNRGGLTGSRLETGYDPTDKGFYQGGDLKGLTQRLDYIKGLGTTAIWLAPIFKNRPVQGTGDNASAGYHGYWITDFTQVDPHFGTNADLTKLIDKAHGKGMKVFFDVITNHTADTVDYAEKKYGYKPKGAFPYLDEDGRPFDDTRGVEEVDADSFPYTPVNTGKKVPAWLNDTTMYHNRGDSTYAA